MTQESAFQTDIIEQMVAVGWFTGKSANYNRDTALYTDDVLGYVKESQPKEWEKFCKIYPVDSDKHFINHLLDQLKKADANATDKASRTWGTLGVLRHGLKIRNARFTLCQFKPEHDLNPDTLKRYDTNICRVVPELVYSPYASKAHLDATGVKAKQWRIDLVLFINGLPVATMELKSEFKQALENAVVQYQQTRLPVDPVTNKPEPLLTFKRGALVHFAVSQFEVYMATKLAGKDTYFLPFNKGTKDGGAGNDIPDDKTRYATDYLWQEVLAPDNLLKIVGRFIHLQIDEKEDWEGRKYKVESLIFPRYHQWDVVNRLLEAVLTEGHGNRYLIQHSAGSGKSNSIAWTAHQLSTLYDASGNKQFDSVIVITDRTVLDSQLQDTIYQFEHADGVVGRINNKEGEGSKSEKLAAALQSAQPIIIVTIQTFPFVLKAIENSVVLKERKYAVIADEAHSSQTGSTARELKEVLLKDEQDSEQERTAEDCLTASVEARRNSNNLNYYAFTATPKPKTLELFGRLPKPDLPPSKQNKPEAFDVYSMRQAIEEGFILDVLKNYTNYKVAYELAQKMGSADEEVDSNKAKLRVNQWVKLHDHNISQKVKVIVEHFKEHVMGLLGGQAKAMVVTGSRKEAVRYKLGFDKYVREKGYESIRAMVAFSGEVTFNSNDPNSEHLIGEAFTEKSMNPELKQEMRIAFQSDNYQVMIVANKFQTGFDQPKLCAMYVDKKLGGVECVQTLSRLNRTYPGKSETGTFVLDFFNEPEEILEAFQPYYQTAELADVSNPELIFDLLEKLKTSGIFLWSEVEQLSEIFYSKSKSDAAISNICGHGQKRWKTRYDSAVEAYKHAKDMFDRTKKTQDPVLIANAETSFKECKQEKDRLEIFKKDLGSFTRFYEFMSQIVDYDDIELEKLSLYARHLRPLLREQYSENDVIDLSSLEMRRYRLAKIRQQDIRLKEDSDEYKLEPGNEVGSAKPKDKSEEFLSQILLRLNQTFDTQNLNENDMVNYASTVLIKLSENNSVMQQIANNTKDQALLGDFSQALDDAILDSSDVHNDQKMQLLTDPQKRKIFADIIYDMMINKFKPGGLRT